jgi:hypothetical protein
MPKKILTYRLQITILLTCLMQLAGLDMYAHSCAISLPSDTIKNSKQIPVRIKPRARFTIADSIDNSNKKRLNKLGQPIILNGDTTKIDTAKLQIKKIFNPSPIKATWLAIIFPGAGQIYNRKLWKLPLVYGAFAGCAYALSWNNKMYKDYAQAYRDIMDKDPTTHSYTELLPAGYSYTTAQLSTILKTRKDLYRRYRDMSIFSIIGVYLLSIVDAYVDAELSNFDISPDLSMHVEPQLMNNNTFTSPNQKAFGIQCSLRF